jgi:phenylalanyl-tRNA synthetase beta chain
MFSRYCGDQFTVEICEVETPEGKINNYPILKNRHEKISVDKINTMVGINEKADEIANLLTRMCLTATVEGTGSISVKKM